MRSIALCCTAICSQDGETALMCAAAEGHTDCARLLIDAGADKEAKNKVCTAVVAVFFFQCSRVIDADGI
jgi:ankyrin repeat protein